MQGRLPPHYPLNLHLDAITKPESKRRSIIVGMTRPPSSFLFPASDGNENRPTLIWRQISWHNQRNAKQDSITMPMADIGKRNNGQMGFSTRAAVRLVPRQYLSWGLLRMAHERTTHRAGQIDNPRQR